MWDSLCVPDDILKALRDINFDEPTPIQQKVLPIAIRDRSDILGSAPTGSGKTLAFGIPLICRVLDAKIQSNDTAKHDLDPATKNAQIFPKPSKKAKSSSAYFTHSVPLELKRCWDASISDSSSVAVEYKRRKVMNDLAIIEELDPDTMNVVKVHDLSKAEVAMPSVETPSSCVLGLVILPTRELAIQVTSHLRAMVKYISSPSITIEAIVGGISVQKQDRILRQRRPDIVVATPGRLWEFIQQEHEHLLSMPRTLVGVVFDEADRLVESQHFVELGSILNFLRDKPDNVKRQTFVFSATLTFVHNNALLPGSNSKKSIKKLSVGKKMDTNSKLNFLRDMLCLSTKAKVVDLSSSDPNRKSKNKTSDGECVSESRVLLPPGLSEFRLVCQDQMDKDALLLWFLLAVRLTNPGRALVFINSKSGARRLSGVLRQCPDVASVLSILHADMIQKQRLRSLERFQATEKSVVLATDVAARGLDFASCSVSWVIHFDVPRTAEIYIHRCGRTARANRPGRSVMLLAPGDIVQWRKLAKNLHLSSDKGVFDFPDLKPAPTVEDLTHFRSIIRIMREMDLIQHSASKKDAGRDWFVRTAREADLDMGSDLEFSSDEEGGPKRKSAKQTATASVKLLKRELVVMLATWRERMSRKTKNQQAFFYGKRKCFVSQDVVASN